MIQEDLRKKLRYYAFLISDTYQQIEEIEDKNIDKNDVKLNLEYEKLLNWFCIIKDLIEEVSK